jgi:O-antigen/teichoic acid export membrane protein
MPTPRYTLALMENQITRAAQNATAIAVSTMLARGIQFAWVIILARLLRVSDYGAWGMISALIVTAAAIPEFGMGVIVLRDVAQRPRDAGRYLSATLAVQPLLALVAYVGLIVVALLLPGDTPTRLLIALAALSLIVDTLGNMCYNQLIAAEQMVATSVISVLHIVFQIAFAFTALTTGGGLPGLYLATLLAGLLRVAMFWAVMLRFGIRPAWPPDTRIVRGLFRDGFPIALNSFLNLAYQHVNKLIVFALLTREDAGYLTAAFIIVFGVVDLINNTVLIALFPAMSRLSQSQPQALRALADRLAFLTLAVTVPLGVGISALSSRLAVLLFPGFVGTAAVLEVLIWHAVLMMVGNFYAQLMIIQNRQGRLVLIQATALVLNIALNLLLLPALGVRGAGVALFISQAVILALYLLEHRPDRPTLRSMAQRAVSVAISGLAMAATLYVLGSANLFIAAAAGVAVYIGVALLLRVLLPDDWTLLRTAVAALPVVGPAITRRLLTAASR